jgi:hypothetical protein
MANINLDFSHYSDPALASVVGGILTDMAAAVATFPTPTPTLPNMQTALDDFIDALNDSQGGSYVNHSIKNDKRLALEKLLKKLGNYVRLTADDDHTKLLLSGFPMSEESGPIGPLPKPTLTIKVGPASGTLQLKSTNVKGADSFNFDYTTTPVTPQSVWTTVTSSRSKIELTGLPSGVQHAFRVTPIGADPSRTPSDIITSFVL